jgi:hypothetical protein
MSERNGRLTVDAERAVLNFERHLPFPIDVVWSAITDHDEREQWFGETTIDAREGGMIEMVATATVVTRTQADDGPHTHVGPTQCARTRMKAADRRGRCGAPGGQTIGVELAWNTMVLTSSPLHWRPPSIRASGTPRCWPTPSQRDRGRQAPT